MFDVANLNDLFSYGSGNTYEVAVGKLQDQLKDMERSSTRNSLALMAGMQVMASGIRNDIHKSTYALSNTIQGMEDGIRSDIREGTYILKNSIQDIEHGIRGDIRESTYALVASQKILADTFSQGFNSVNNRLDIGFSVLASGMKTLSSDINSLTNDVFAMSEAICNKLDALHDIMNKPLLTASRELYRRAVDEFERGLYEEALESCKQAIEKNKTDFISWYLLGQIYLYGAGKFSNVIDVDQAEISFFNAAKYIDVDIGKTEEANKLASEIYYYLGYSRLIKSNDLLVENNQAESKVKLSEAEDASREAWRLSDTNLLAAYEQAKELHFLEKDNEALHVLETIIRIEKNFALKASCDKNFESIWNRIDDLIKKLRDEIVSKIKPQIEDIAPQVKMLSTIDAWGINHLDVLIELESLLPNETVYDNYFSIREFDEKTFKDIQTKMNELISHCLYYPETSCHTYNRTLELYSSGNEEETLKSLEANIRAEWYFAVKSACDKKLEPLWSKIAVLTEKLKQEAEEKISAKNEELRIKLSQFCNEFETLDLPSDYEIETHIKDNIGTALYSRDEIPRELNKLTSLLETNIKNAELLHAKDYFSLREFWEKLNVASQVEWKHSFLNVGNLISNLKGCIDQIRIHKENEEIENKRREEEAAIWYKTALREKRISIFKAVLFCLPFFAIAEIIPALYVYAAFFDNEHVYIGSFDLADMSFGLFFLILAIVSGIVGATYKWFNELEIGSAIKGFFAGAVIGAIVNIILLVIMALIPSVRKIICIAFDSIYTICILIFIVCIIKDEAEFG